MLLSCFFIANSPESQNASKHEVNCSTSAIRYYCVVLDSAFLLVRKDLEVGHLASQSLFAAYSSCPRVSD